MAGGAPVSLIIDGGSASSSNFQEIDPGGASGTGRLGISLTDCNGVTWDLINGPVRLTRGGLVGLGFPQVIWEKSESASIDGQRLEGYRLDSRQVVLPIRFKDEAARDTTGIQRKWWNGLAIGQYVTLTVTRTSPPSTPTACASSLTIPGGMATRAT
jgi:hypothetical protein